MEIVNLKRNAGKTNHIVAWVKEKPESRIMVVFDQNERTRVMLEYDMQEYQVVTFAAARSSREFGMKKGGEMMIDNLDICLQRSLPLSDCFKLVGFSLTDEPAIPNYPKQYASTCFSHEDESLDDDDIGHPFM